MTGIRSWPFFQSLMLLNRQLFTSNSSSSRCLFQSFDQVVAEYAAIQPMDRGGASAVIRPLESPLPVPTNASISAAVNVNVVSRNVLPCVTDRHGGFCEVCCKSFKDSRRLQEHLISVSHRELFMEVCLCYINFLFRLLLLFKS